MCVTQYNRVPLFSLSLQQMMSCLLLDQIVLVSECKIITNVFFLVIFALKWTRLEENFGCAVNQLLHKWLFFLKKTRDQLIEKCF